MVALEKQRFKLRLYINGDNSRSRNARVNLQALLDKYLPELFDLEIFDVREALDEIEEDDILATPTVVRHDPEPRLRLVGDLSNEIAVVEGIEIPDTGNR